MAERSPTVPHIKPSTDDFKEQMAARYQERLSMGFNIPDNLQKNSPEVCQRQLSPPQHQGLEHPEIKYSTHSYRKQPHSIRKFSLSWGDVHHDNNNATQSKDQSETKLTSPDIDQKILQSKEPRRGVAVSSSTKELIERFESVNVCEASKTISFDKTTKNCNNIDKDGRSQSKNTTSISPMTPSPALRKEGSKSTPLECQPNSDSNRTFGTKATFNKGVSLPYNQEKKVDSKKRGRNASEMNNSYSFKTDPINTETTNAITTLALDDYPTGWDNNKPSGSSTDSKSFMCNNDNHKSPMSMDDKKKSSNIPVNTDTIPPVLSTPTRVDLRGLVRKTQAAVDNKPPPSLRGRSTESSLERYNLRRNITKQPAVRPVPTHELKSNNKTKQKGREVDTQRQQQQQLKRQQPLQKQQKQQEQQHQSPTKDTKRVQQNGTQKLRKGTVPPDHVTRKDTKKGSSAMEKYLVFLKRSTPSNGQYPRPSYDTLTSDKEDNIDYSRAVPTLRRTPLEAEKEKELEIWKPSLSACSQPKQTNDEPEHEQTKTNTADSSIPMATSLNIKTSVGADNYLRQESKESFELEKSPHSYPIISPKQDEPLFTTESNDDIGNEHKIIPLENNIIQSQPVDYYEEKPMERGRSPIAILASMLKSGTPRGLDSAFSGKTTSSASRLHPIKDKYTKSPSNESMKKVKTPKCAMSRSSSQNSVSKSPRNTSSRLSVPRQSRERNKLNTFSPVAGGAANSSHRLILRSPSTDERTMSKSQIKNLPEKPPTPKEVFRSHSHRSTTLSPTWNQEKKKCSSLTYLRKHKTINVRVKQPDSPKVPSPSRKNTRSPRHLDISSDDQDYPVKELRSRYKQAKNMMKQRMHMQKKKYNNPGTDYLSPFKNPNDIVEHLLLTKDDLADTELVPFHLRDHVYDKETLKQHNISPFSSSDDDEQNAAMINNLKRIKASRLLRMITNHHKDSTVGETTATEENLARLLANFVEATRKGDEYKEPPTTTLKKSSNHEEITTSTSTTTQLVPKANSDKSWPSKNFMADKSNILASLTGSLANKDAGHAVDGGGSVVLARKFSSEDLIPNNAYDTAQEELMDEKDSQAPTNEYNKLDLSPDPHIISNRSRSPSCLSDHSEQSLLSEGRGVRVSSYRSSSPCHRPVDSEFEEKPDEDGGKGDVTHAKRATIMLADVPPDTAIEVTYERSPCRSVNEINIMHPEATVAPTKGGTSSSVESHYILAVDKLHKTLPHPFKGKRKARNEETMAKKRKKSEGDGPSKVKMIRVRENVESPMVRRFHQGSESFHYTSSVDTVQETPRNQGQTRKLKQTQTSNRSHNVSPASTKPDTPLHLRQESRERMRKQSQMQKAAKQTYYDKKRVRNGQSPENNRQTYYDKKRVRNGQSPENNRQHASVEGNQNVSPVASKQETPQNHRQSTPCVNKCSPRRKEQSPDFESVVETSRISVPPKVRKLTSHPVEPRWPIRSSIPLLVSLKPRRSQADVVSQHRRCLDDLTNQRRPSKIPMASSFMKTLIDSAVEEWTMHCWTQPIKCTQDGVPGEETAEDSTTDAKSVILPDSLWTNRNLQVRRLYEIYMGVWAAMATIVYAGYRISSCAEDELDIFCTEDDVTCLSKLVS